MSIFEKASQEITSIFKVVIENYHLYQSYPAELFVIDKVQAWGKLGGIHQHHISLATAYLRNPWEVLNPYGAVATQPSERISFYLPTLKLFCKKCDNVEAYNPISGQDVFSYLNKGKTQPGAIVNQVFVLIYECQSCKGIPEVFLIRRIGEKIGIHGRTPIEFIKVPDQIPKEEKKYYSDAVLAFNTGQILPALFMLRVFIEQFVYRITGNKSGLADVEIDTYYDGLPNDFKDRFPSLREIYEKLSVAIHTANPNKDLFQESIEKLDYHFEARRTYRLDKQSAPGVEAPTAPADAPKEPE